MNFTNFSEISPGTVHVMYAEVAGGRVSLFVNKLSARHHIVWYSYDKERLRCIYNALRQTHYYFLGEIPIRNYWYTEVVDWLHCHYGTYCRIARYIWTHCCLDKMATIWHFQIHRVVCDPHYSIYSIYNRPGARPTKRISIEFEIHWKFQTL